MTDIVPTATLIGKKVSGNACGKTFARYDSLPRKEVSAMIVFRGTSDGIRLTEPMVSRSPSHFIKPSTRRDGQKVWRSTRYHDQSLVLQSDPAFWKIDLTPFFTPI